MLSVILLPANLASFANKFLFQGVPGCNDIADLSLKIVFGLVSLQLGLIDIWKQRVPGHISPKL